jgi:serine/threonine-protein kinase
MSVFLRELFEVANPAMASGETVTARELLDRGAERIREHHEEDPELAAEMLTVLGSVYSRLGLPEPALELLYEARDIQERHPGLPAEHSGATLHELGRALRESGYGEEAVAVLRQARDRLEDAHGPEHRDVALATADLALAMHAGGDMSAAEPEFQRAIELFRTLEVEPNNDYAMALYLLGDYRMVTGELDGVGELYGEALSVLESLYGRDHPNVPPVLQSLAWLEERQGNRDEGLRLAREALQIDIALYQDVESGTHPSLGLSHFSFGRHLTMYGGDPAEAEAALLEAVRILESTPQPRPGFHGQALLTLGILLRDHDRPAESIAYFERAVAVFQDAFGTGSLMEAGVQVDMADALLSLDRSPEARDLLEAALRAYDGVLPDTHARIEQARRLLVRAGAG